MGGGASRSKAGASTEGAMLSDIPTKSAPGSPIRTVSAGDVTAGALKEAFELDNDRPSTTNENWRMTPREETKPPPDSDAAESRSTAESNAKRSNPGSTDSNDSLGGSSPFRPAPSAGGSPQSAHSPQHVAAPLGSPEKVTGAEVGSILRSSGDPVQVLELAQGAFGPMVSTSLASPKWDRRAEAIKGIEQMVKAADLASGLASLEQQRSVLIAMRILEQALRDKVWPVLGAAFSLYKVVLDHSTCLSAEDRDAGIDMLLPVLNTRLGDSNTRIHDAAVTAILATAAVGPDTPRACLRVIVDSLRGDKSKVDKASQARLTGALLMMQRLVRQQGCSDVMEEAKPVLEIALEHPKEKVRALSLDIVADVTRAGYDLELKLRPALEDALQQRLMELEDQDQDGDGDGECFDVPDFAVVGMKATLNRTFELEKPALDFADDEEAFMDNILDETGLAFQNTSEFKIPGSLNSTKELNSTGFLPALNLPGEPFLSDVDALEAEFLRDLEGLGDSP